MRSCVCVCERERERERASPFNVVTYLAVTNLSPAHSGLFCYIDVIKEEESIESGWGLGKKKVREKQAPTMMADHTGRIEAGGKKFVDPVFALQPSTDRSSGQTCNLVTR